MRGYDHAGASLSKFFNNGQGSTHATVVGHHAIFKGNVQVGANENVAACDAFFEQFCQCLSHRIILLIMGFRYF